MPETTPDLARLEALERAATPGEWYDGGQLGPMGIYADTPENRRKPGWSLKLTEQNRALIAALRNAAPWLLAQAREAERLREEARSNTDYFAAYVRRAETAETRLAEVERERDQWRDSGQHHGAEAMRLAGERDAVLEANQTLTAALVPLASEAQRYTDPEDRYLKRLADEAQAALDQARGGGA